MASTTSTDQPSVYLHIEGSFIAKDDNGEILETVELNDDGTPNWTYAGGCDYRGVGGVQGYRQLVAALDAAEANAAMFVDSLVRVAS